MRIALKASQAAPKAAAHCQIAKHPAPALEPDAAKMGPEEPCAAFRLAPWTAPRRPASNRTRTRAETNMKAASGLSGFAVPTY